MMCQFCKEIYGKPQEDVNYYPDENHIYQFADGSYCICVYGGSCVERKTLRGVTHCPICGRNLTEE